MLEIVNANFLAFEENTIEAQRTAHHKWARKIRNMLLIHQCVDSNIFKKIIEHKATKGVWKRWEIEEGQTAIFEETIREHADEWWKSNCRFILKISVADQSNKIM